MWQLLDNARARFALDHIPVGSSCFAQSDSMGLPCYEILCSGFLNVHLPDGMRLKVSPKGHHIFKRLLSPMAQTPWMWCALVGADHSASLSCVLQGSWGLCSWHHIRAEYPGWDTWSALCQTPQVRKEVLSCYCFCLWLPCRKRDIGASILISRVSWETLYSWTKKKSGSCRCVWRKLHVGQSSCNDDTCH